MEAKTYLKTFLILLNKSEDFREKIKGLKSHKVEGSNPKIF